MKLVIARESHINWINNQIETDPNINTYVGLDFNEKFKIKNDDWYLSLIVQEGEQNVAFIEYYFDSKVNRIELNKFWIDKSHRGKGKSKEIINKSYEMIINKWWFASVYALTVDNERMDKILLSLGWERIGYIKNWRFHNGKFRDYKFFKISRNKILKSLKQ